MKVFSLEGIFKEREFEESLKKDDIDQYLNENKIYDRLYEVLLGLNYDFDILDIFNQAHIICEKIKLNDKPELYAEELFDGFISSIECGNCLVKSKELYNNYHSPIKECASVVFSCVYVILSQSECPNTRIPKCLIRIKAIVIPDIFKLFKGLLKKKKSDEKQAETTETEQMPTKYDIFIKEVEKYEFSKMPKLKGVAEDKIKELITKIVETIPYGVAMLEYLEYRDYLGKKYTLKSRESQYKHIAKAFQVNKDTIKGHVLVYNNPTIKKANNYSAYQFKKEVEKFYKELLSK